DEGLAQRPLQIRRDQSRHDVVQTARRERDDQANGAIGISVGVSAGGAERDERHDQEGGVANAGPPCGGSSHCMRPIRHRCVPRLLVPAPARSDQATSFSISPTTASPICAVVTTLAPSDLMSAVRSPCASAAAIAWSIWSASLAILSE